MTSGVLTAALTTGFYSTYFLTSGTFAGAFNSALTCYFTSGALAIYFGLKS